MYSLERCPSRGERSVCYIGKDFSRYYGRKWIDLVREESLAKHLKNGAAQRDTTDLPPLYFLQRGSLAEKEMEPDLPDQEIPGVDIARAKEILAAHPEAAATAAEVRV